VSLDQRVVVVGASAGGVEALIQLVRILPTDLAAPVCIVLHIPADAPSLLAQILNRDSALPAVHAQNMQRWEKGTIYIAPPDRHLLIHADGALRVARGPRENRHRPAVDPLFRSAAADFGPGAIGIILSGTMDDGTAGLRTLKERGGVAIVQDPAEALYPSMPQSAIAHVNVDHVVPISAMGDLLRRLLETPVLAQVAPVRKDLQLEVRMAELDADALHDDDRPGLPSPYSCPDCGGVLWSIDEQNYERFRCRVGHAFAPESMLGAQQEVLEEALWTAAKTLEETALLSSRLAANERKRGHDWMAERFEQKERDARAHIEVLRRYLLRDDATVPVAAGSS
jgi:two-component system, chemotaxis family, protein-glutamate methylesterase/glutaminase